MRKKEQKSLVHSGISLSVLTLFSRLLGLLREMTKAAFLGTSGLSDAFSFAFSAPNLFRRLFAENSVSVAFIPTFKRYLEEEKGDNLKKQATREFVTSTFTLVSFLTAVVTVLGMLLAPLYVPLFIKSSDAATVTEATVLTRIMFPYLIVISVAAFFQGILNSIKIFAPSGFTPILLNLIVIGSTYILSPYTANPARAMAIGVIAGGSVQALFQLPFVLKQNWKVRFTSLKSAFTNKGTRTVLKLIGPTIFGMAAYQLNDLVSIGLAGNAGEGVLSSLQFSLRLQELVLGIFAVSISTVILPDLTEAASQKDSERFTSLLISSLRIMIFISIPVTAFSILTGENLIRLIYEAKAFDDTSVILTQMCFNWHIAGLVFIAVNRILAPAFYSVGNTKAPALAGIICFAVNALLAVMLAGPLKGAGIALALSAASAVNTVVLFIFMKKQKFENVGTIIKTALTYCLRMLLLSAVATAVTWLIKAPVFNAFSGHHKLVSQGIPLIICGFVFAGTGVVMMFITRDPLIITLKTMLKKKRG